MNSIRTIHRCSAGFVYHLRYWYIWKRSYDIWNSEYESSLTNIYILYLYILDPLFLFLTWWHDIRIAAHAHTPDTPWPEACSKNELLNSDEFQPEMAGASVTVGVLAEPSTVVLSTTLSVMAGSAQSNLWLLRCIENIWLYVQRLIFGISWLIPSTIWIKPYE